MKNNQIESVGKVFVVISGMRRCLICDGMFTPKQAATHATIPCYPTTMESALRVLFSVPVFDACAPEKA
jgi:hypothetical protein